MKRFEVRGMSCAACSARVEGSVRALPGVSSCSVNLLTGSMTVEGDVSSSDIISAVTKAGYGITEVDKTAKKDNNSLQKHDKTATVRRLIASVAILIPLMYISMGYVMWGAPAPAVFDRSPILVALIEMVLTGTVLIINRHFFINGVKAAFSLSPNMDTLVSLGSGASFVYSVGIVFLMITGGDAAHSAHYLHELYFESAAMIVTLISVGKMLESRAKGKTTDAIGSLLSLSPKKAVVVRSGREITIPADEVLVGDVFILRPGDAVPCDGVVLRGESSIYEAALTGESIPSDKSVGDKVMAATVNGSGYLECRAEKVGADTVIAEVIRLVDEASSSKAPIAKAADRVSGFFVPAVRLIAVISFIIWLVSGANIGYALGRAISVLVISCPCALGLATPVAIMVGVGVGAKRGILYKSAEAIEAVGRARTVAFDKTGTLTEGRPTVTDVVLVSGTEEEIISVALTLEEKSEQPLARAIVEYGERLGVGRLILESFESLSGSGVRGVISGEVCTAGKYSFVSERDENPNEKNIYEALARNGKTPVFVTRGDTLLGVIGISDKVREGAPSLIKRLSRMGLKTVMLTGDNSYTGAAIGSQLGIDEVLCELLPADKEREIRRLRRGGGVIMVGDGINDAPSLTSADAGIAVGGGTDIAIESASVVLMRNDLSEVYHAVRLGRKTLKNIYENLFWAFIYNAVGIPLAAGAFVGLFGWELSPMIGALAMSLSSFSVVMNALRLNFYGGEERTGDDSHVSCKEGAGESGENEEIKEEAKEKIKEENEKEFTNEIEEELKEEESTVKYKLKIEGMMCPHCEARVKNTLISVEGVVSAEVSHERGEAEVLCKEALEKTLSDAVTEQGYTVTSVEKM